MIEFELNGQAVQTAADPAMPLLWYLRDDAGLTGTKYGCGIAQCGACTVHVNGQAMRACMVPLSAAAGASVRTIEGIDSAAGRAVQSAWAALDVVQCGYCQSGQIMSAAALLARKPAPTDADIDSAMQGNLCRCATYQRIRAAIHSAARALQEGPTHG